MHPGKLAIAARLPRERGGGCDPTDNARRTNPRWHTRRRGHAYHRGLPRQRAAPSGKVRRSGGTRPIVARKDAAYFSVETTARRSSRPATWRSRPQSKTSTPKPRRSSVRSSSSIPACSAQSTRRRWSWRSTWRLALTMRPKGGGRAASDSRAHAVCDAAVSCGWSRGAMSDHGWTTSLSRCTAT